SSHSHLSPGLFVRMFKKGLPITVQMVVISTSLLFLISLANPYGTLTVAAYGACLQLWAYIQMPAFAIASAVGTMAAHNIGAGLWDRVAQVTRHGIICGLILTISLVALAKLTEHGALQIFLGDNHAAINAASRINDIVSWSFIPFSVPFPLVAVMRSAGQTLVPLLITFLGLWVVRVPLAFFLRPYLEQDAIFWSTP